MQKPAWMIGAVIKPLAKNPETLAVIILHAVIIAQLRHIVADRKPPFWLNPLRPFGKAIVCLAVCALQRRSAVATDRAPGSPRTPHHTDFYILLQHDGFSTSVIDFLPDVRITIFDADT